MKCKPKLVSRARMQRYFEDLSSGALEGADICQGCPYSFACCEQGATYLTAGEVDRISRATGKPSEAFIHGPIPTGPLRGFYEGRNPCIFLKDSTCTVYDTRPQSCRRGICDYAYRNYETAITKGGE